MTAYTARWLLPISRPLIPGGTVTVDRGTVVSVGDSAPPDAIDLGSVAILPGLVNAMQAA